MQDASCYGPATHNRPLPSHNLAGVHAEALRDQHNTAESAQLHQVHPSQVAAWRRRTHQVVVDTFAAGWQRPAGLAVAVQLAKMGELQMLIDELEGNLPQLTGGCGGRL